MKPAAASGPFPPLQSPPVRRLLFNLAAALSLVLALAVAVLWVRSATSYGVISFTRALPRDVSTGTSVLIRYALASQHGQIGLSRSRHDSLDRMPFVWTHGWQVGSFDALPGAVTATVDEYGRSIFGFGYVDHTWDKIGESGYRFQTRSIVIPHWFIVLLFVLPPAGLAWRERRVRSRARAGLCPTCGYDCRGPAVGTLLPRCPECGTDLPQLKPANDDQREEPVARGVEGLPRSGRGGTF